MDNSREGSYFISWGYPSKKQGTYYVAKKDQIIKATKQLKELFETNKNLFLYYCCYVCSALNEKVIKAYGLESHLQHLEPKNFSKYDTELKNLGLVNHNTNKVSNASKVLVSTIVIIWAGQFLSYSITDLSIASLIKPFNPLTLPDDCEALVSSINSK